MHKNTRNIEKHYFVESNKIDEVSIMNNNMEVCFMNETPSLNLYRSYSVTLRKFVDNEQIFDYAIKYMSLYRPQDIKYTLDDLDRFMTDTLGQSFSYLAMTHSMLSKPDRQYKYIDSNNHPYSASSLNFNWDRHSVPDYCYNGIMLTPEMSSTNIDLTEIYEDKTLDLFENNFQTFYRFLSPYFLYYSYIDDRSSKLINLKAFKNYNNSFTSILFTKNDGDKIEFDVTVEDIDYLIRTLNKVKVMMNEDE